MAEKTLEEAVCEACGADRRPDTLFCYNCGSSLTVEAEESSNGKDANKVWLRENLVEDNNQDNSQRTTNRLEPPIPKPLDLPVEKTGEKTVQYKPVIETSAATAETQEAKLKAAAEQRQKARLEKKKPVEMSWEEPDSSPGMWFFLAALVLVGLAVGLLFAMLYIR